MTRNDIPLVDEIFADAFARNQVARFLFGPGDIRSRVMRLNRTTVRHQHSRGTIAELGGHPVGAMLETETPRCEPSGLDGLRFTLDAMLSLRGRIWQGKALAGEASKNHPKWPHRHLAVLGVLRDFQGQGVGSALLKKFCEEADAAGANGYLETDSEGGKRLYERFGFREVNRTRHRSMSFIYMWRTAKTT